MQRTANFHHQIADARLAEAAGVVNNATALDAAVDVLDAHTTARDAPIGGFLCACERPAPWLLGGHDDLSVVEKARKPRSWSNRLPGGKGYGVASAIRLSCVLPA
jgi:hypothetical protein